MWLLNQMNQRCHHKSLRNWKEILVTEKWKACSEVKCESACSKNLEQQGKDE